MFYTEKGVAAMAMQPCLKCGVCQDPVNLLMKEVCWDCAFELSELISTKKVQCTSKSCNPDDHTAVAAAFVRGTLIDVATGIPVPKFKRTSISLTVPEPPSPHKIRRGPKRKKRRKVFKGQEDGRILTEDELREEDNIISEVISK